MGATSKSPLWARLLRSGEALAGVVLSASNRAETVTWYEGAGHAPGQITDWQEAGGLMVRLRVGEMSTNGSVLFRAELFNPGTRLWKGGVALTDRPHEDSEGVLTLAPAQTADWWTWLGHPACLVFVRIDPTARLNA